jgi:hypothetical protein
VDVFCINVDKAVYKYSVCVKKNLKGNEVTGNSVDDELEAKNRRMYSLLFAF